MKGMRLFVLGLFVGAFLLACGSQGISEDSKKWLKNYEVVVDQYLDYVNTQIKEGNKDSKMSKDLDQKLSSLSKEADAIRKNLKPRETMYFYKEFGRITAKLSVGEIQKIIKNTNH